MNVLIVAPHSDDEVLGVGGTSVKHLDAGDNVTLIVCGSRKHDVVDHTHDATSHYTETYILPYEDEHYYDSFDNMLKSIEDIYNQSKPDIIYIPNRSDFNRDHRCVHEICEIVCRRYQLHSPKMVLMYEIPSSTTQSFQNNFHCNWYESLTREQLDFKIKTFNKYESEVREYPNPRSSDGIESYAKFRGMECNNEFAEGFNVLYCVS